MQGFFIDPSFRTSSPVAGLMLIREYIDPYPYT